MIWNGYFILFLVVLALGLLYSVVDQGIPNARIIQRTSIQPSFGNRYKTKTDLIFCINENTLTVPAGFETDLASIPRVFWSFIHPAHSKLMEPSIVHDYLYRYHSNLSRREIDALFYSLLLKEGCGVWTAKIIYVAVRLFGYYSYR